MAERTRASRRAVLAGLAAAPLLAAAAPCPRPAGADLEALRAAAVFVMWG